MTATDGPGRFVLKQTPAGFCFQMVSSGGRVLLTSDRYPSRGKALLDIDTIRRDAPGALVEDTTSGG